MHWNDLLHHRVDHWSREWDRQQQLRLFQLFHRGLPKEVVKHTVYQNEASKHTVRIWEVPNAVNQTADRNSPEFQMTFRSKMSSSIKDSLIPLLSLVAFQNLFLPANESPKDLHLPVLHPIPCQPSRQIRKQPSLFVDCNEAIFSHYPSDHTNLHEVNLACVHDWKWCAAGWRGADWSVYEHPVLIG